MNWDALAAIGELVGAGAVLITLIYLLIQVKQHSRSINSITTQTSISHFNEITMLLAANPKLAEILERGNRDPDLLSAEEHYSYTWLVRSILNVYVNLFDQYKQGACADYLWDRNAQELKAIYDSAPGIRHHRNTDPGFEELFAFIDQLPRKEGWHSFNWGEQAELNR